MTFASIDLHLERPDATIKLGNHVVIVPAGCPQPFHRLNRGYEVYPAMTLETTLTCLHGLADSPANA